VHFFNYLPFYSVLIQQLAYATKTGYTYSSTIRQPIAQTKQSEDRCQGKLCLSCKDLVVLYKVFQNDGVQKTGKITIRNTEQSNNIRFAQSWRSSTGEYINELQCNITAMSKAFVTKLAEEL